MDPIDGRHEWTPLVAPWMGPIDALWLIPWMGPIGGPMNGPHR